MQADQFNRIVKEQVMHCLDLLSVKAGEYATADRLHNFKTAAEIQECTPVQALGGMMAKHTVSVYDMINTGDTYTKELWDEKITDHINYLLLLKALVEENRQRYVTSAD